MCFAPYISLSTFVIEVLLAIFFFVKNPKDKLNRIVAIISLGLGLYQLNEFLICITKVPVFTILAMSVTAILPALAISFALVVWKKKLNSMWMMLIYSPAIFFIIMFSVNTYLNNSAQCMSVFVQYPDSGLIGRFFELYYFVYILGAAALFNFSSTHSKSVPEKRISQLGLLSMFIFPVPTFIFLIFLPSLEVQFASILCEFALLLAIEFIFLLWYKEKHKLSYK